MPPIGFLQLLFEERHLLFGGELLWRRCFIRRGGRGCGRGFCRLGRGGFGSIAGFIFHRLETLADPPAFFQFTYNSSTFARAQGVRRRNVRLDLMLGSYWKHRIGTRRPRSSHPKCPTSSVSNRSRVMPCSGSLEAAIRQRKRKKRRWKVGRTSRQFASTDPRQTIGVPRRMKNIVAALALAGSLIFALGCATFPEDTG